MSHGERIAEHLLAIEAVKLSVDPPFTWTSGIQSPIYCDNRMMYGHPDSRDVIVSALVSRVKSLHIPPDAIVGTATAAIGWGMLVADRLKLPFAYVRSKAKEHGTRKMIEGYVQPGSDVVLIEDLISTGGSAMHSVAALRDEGQCRIADVVSIFTYEFDEALELAAEQNVRIHPLATISTLLQVAEGMNKIHEEERALITEFIKNPKTWRK